MILTWPPSIVQGAVTALPGVGAGGENAPLTVTGDTGTGHGQLLRFKVECNPGQDLVDIDFRSCTFSIGDTDPNASLVGTQMGIYGASGDTTNRFVIWRNGSKTIQAAYFGPTGTLALQTVGQATLAIGVKAAGDAQNTFDIQSTGQLDWGTGGSSAPDTNLYRGAAGQLKTDSALAVGGNAGFNGTAPIAKPAHPATLSDVITILTNYGLCS